MTSEDKPIHVYPVGDVREHEVEGKECWCNPEISLGDEDGIYMQPIVIHNSADGREITEGVCLNKPKER